MIRFKMYTEYEDGSNVEVVRVAGSCDKAEALCMDAISAYSEKYGKCTYYTCVNGYDEELGGYWVDGEWFDDYDVENGIYVKNN